ncbi:porin [Gymnodinialimonas hymeniacidonis]|uniref:porin n=1 Tax=Gymnodinialimonas hymeniacidonis TaxID=3126508 RepID=UPI0034C5B8BD
MKKVLFATTALVATAGYASADVALSGSAQMGVQGGSGTTITQFVQDIDVTFTMSGETDSGITFGAAIDLDESASGVGTDDAGVAIFVSGDFGTLTMGDTDGGFDAGMQEVNIGSPGSINDNETTHSGYSGNSGLDGLYDGQILSYSYSVSGFTITGSIEMDDDAGATAAFVGANNGAIDGALVAPVTGADPAPFNIPGYAGAILAGDGLTGDAIYGIGASYAGSFGGGSYTVGAGYQTVQDFDADLAGAQGITIMGISATVALDSGFSAGFNYSQIDVEGLGIAARAGNAPDALGAAVIASNFSGTHMAIGASYAFGDITVHANYGQYDWDPTAYAYDSSGYGLAASYDLGGGLSAHIGYGSSSIDALNASADGYYGASGPAAATGTSSNWSLGVAMSF